MSNTQIAKRKKWTVPVNHGQNISILFLGIATSLRLSQLLLNIWPCHRDKFFLSVSPFLTLVAMRRLLIVVPIFTLVAGDTDHYMFYSTQKTYTYAEFDAKETIPLPSGSTTLCGALAKQGDYQAFQVLNGDCNLGFALVGEEKYGGVTPDQDFYAYDNKSVGKINAINKSKPYDSPEV